MINLKKLFAAPCCLCLLFSCGKKPVSSENSDTELDTVITLPGESGAKNLSVEFVPSNESSKDDSYQAKRNAWVRIPENPIINSGEALIVSTRFYINYKDLSALNNSEEIYCDYRSVKMIGPQGLNAHETYNHYFKGCFEDIDGDGTPENINFIPGDEVGLEKDHFILMRVTASSDEETLSVSSSIEVDYL